MLFEHESKYGLDARLQQHKRRRRKYEKFIRLARPEQSGGAGEVMVHRGQGGGSYLGKGTWFQFQLLSDQFVTTFTTIKIWQ